VTDDDEGRPAVEDGRVRLLRRYELAFEDSAIGMVIEGLDGRFVAVNSTFCQLVGYSRAQLLTMTYMDICHPDDLEGKEHLASLADGTLQTYIRELRYIRADRVEVWVRVHIGVIKDETGRAAYYSVQIEDITTRKVAEDLLTHQADHDALTGLPNRHAFTRQLEATARASSPADRRALLFIDLDRFKLVNDSLGHTVGDELLIAVAGRLRAAIAEEDLVARIGGDEFVVLARSSPTAETAKLLAERVRQVLQEPFSLAGRTLYLTASVGIAVPEPGARSEGLLPAADLAMHGAKANGRAGAMVFDPAMQRRADARLATEQGLHQALEKGELVLWYQSIFSLVTGQPVAAEALVRWQHPQAGLLEPAAFLPVAEDTGLIVPIGRYVIEEALDQVRLWRRHGLGLAVNVNLASAQLNDPDLVGEIGSMLAERGLVPCDLCLEVSEKSVLTAGNRAARTVTALRRLGVSVAIDDFGAGASSLAYLRRTPVDVVKIDGAFVGTIDTNPRDAAIVGALIHLTHALGMTCVAEGVETRAQLQCLAALGCDQIQGFLTARAQPPERWLATVSQPHLYGSETPLTRLIGVAD
jgi:diguanylate cyclase (GGDEF)-like protein/PAS domain S-box-containing protein